MTHRWKAVEASDRIVAYLDQLVDTKRRRPTDDLVSVMAAANDDALTTQELLSSLFQLVVAGHDTTTSRTGNGVVALLDHPRPGAAGRSRAASRRNRRAFEALLGRHPGLRPRRRLRSPGHTVTVSGLVLHGLAPRRSRARRRQG